MAEWLEEVSQWDEITVMIWRSWVRTPVGSNLGCVVLVLSHTWTKNTLLDLITMWMSRATTFLDLTTMWMNPATMFLDLTTMWMSPATMFLDLTTMWMNPATKVSGSDNNVNESSNNVSGSDDNVNESSCNADGGCEVSRSNYVWITRILVGLITVGLCTSKLITGGIGVITKDLQSVSWQQNVVVL